MPNKETLFENLHKEYHPMVHQLCLGFLKGDNSLAQDLTQEVFINTWAALKNFKGAASYKTWIYRITVNTCLKFIRDAKKNQHLPLDEWNKTLVNTEPKSNSESNPYQPLYRAIGQLKEVDRLLIMMVLDGLEYGEIAEVIGIQLGNVRVKIHRIKKTLKNILQNE